MIKGSSSELISLESCTAKRTRRKEPYQLAALFLFMLLEYSPGTGLQSTNHSIKAHYSAKKSLSYYNFTNSTAPKIQDKKFLLQQSQSHIGMNT